MKNPTKSRPVTEDAEIVSLENQNSADTFSLSAHNVQVVTLSPENLGLLLERIRDHQVVPAIFQRKEN